MQTARKIVAILGMILGLGSGSCLYSLDCLCPPSPNSIRLDTLTDGVVLVTKCYSTSTNEDSCVADTASVQDLLDSLVQDYENNTIAIIGHIKNVISVLDSGIVFPQQLSESLLVVIDSVLKGFFGEESLWVRHAGACKWSAEPMKDRKFLAFFNEWDEIEDMGVYPRTECDKERAYFLNQDTIVKSGEINGLPGVSVQLNEFLAVIAASSVRRRMHDHAKKNEIDIYRSYFTEWYMNNKKSVAQSGISTVRILNMTGQVVGRVRDVKSQGALSNPKHLSQGVYFIMVEENGVVHAGTPFVFRK